MPLEVTYSLHFCHPLLVPPQPCYGPLLPHSVFIWVCVLPWIAQMDETLPVALAHQPRRKLTPSRGYSWCSSGCPWAGWGIELWLEAEPQSYARGQPSTSFFSYRLPEPASSRAEQASHRHPGLVAQWEPGEHVATSTRAHQPTRAFPGKSGPQPSSRLPPVLSTCHGL